MSARFSKTIMFLLVQNTHRMLVRYHSAIGHLYVPNLNVRLPNEVGGYQIVTNAQGFRSDIAFEKKKNGRPRILMFGDSYTAGDNCPNPERYSDYLARMLSAEVYNYGLSGSGTDQHLLIHREFAKDVERDLIVICVQIDSMRRIQVSHRESVDRITRQRVMVPKPYFTLENGTLELHHQPVPRERPPAGSVEPGYQPEEAGFRETLLNWYRDNPALSPLRKFLREDMSRVKDSLRKFSGAMPYPDFKSESSAGWQLMKAILQQFIKETAPTPVLIVPVPTWEFYLQGLKPIYQPFFEALADSQRGVYVADVSTPLIEQPYELRQTYSFKVGGHFTPFANEKVASMMADKIIEDKLLPVKKHSSTSPTKRKAGTYVLGISCFYHNSAAALVRDGRIVAAAEEERFTRVKNDRRFPHQAVNYCLEEGRIDPAQLDAVVYYDNAALTFERILHTELSTGQKAADSFVRIMPSWIRYKLHIPELIRKYMHYSGPVLQEVHHRSHAASAFYPSPFESAAILTIDGVGEWATASIGVGKEGKIDLLEEMHFPHSLGLLYSAFTQFTGFKVNSGEYKMMGLAPYGEAKYTKEILDHLINLKEDGSVELNLEYFGFLEKPTMTNEKFADLFGGPARKPDSRITRREIDLAKSIQVVTEEAMLKMARHAKELTGEKYLCLAGGVALNCVANGRLLREGPFDDIWIQPAAGDSGCALGAALDVYHNYFEKPREWKKGERQLQGGSYWGPDFSSDEIQAYLETHNFPYRKLEGKERASYLAQKLEEGKVVGHCAGRLEYGPRALGSRSILGDARNQEMQAELNLKIKYRESFRPFAPSVLAERVQDYFELDRESPYMLIVAPVKEDRRKPIEKADGDDLLPIVRQIRSDLPAITHVDYSARIQTVMREDHETYYDVIKAFEEKTGYGVVVNTSFNVRGEPIVCTPADAYRCFMRTEMNVLAIGDYILLKEEQPEWPEGTAEGLESEDATKAEAATHPEGLIKDLEDLFHKKFLPLAETTKSRIHSQAGWHPAPKTKDLFEFPKGMQNPEGDAEKLAEALAECHADDTLKPLLVDLVKIGMKYPAAEALEEEVSESVYVMF